ncbi:MAG: ABC transporter substrate-binding protein [Oscillospiraceae bacterium]|nr:ABC transporter substrate-binding protein [Oscillospiraceae bacterium]
MKLKRLFCFIMVLVIMLALVGCDDITDDHPNDNVVQTDTPPVKQAYPVDIGAESFDKAPVTVASLSPALTEAMNDIGAFDRLIAVSEYCSWPSDANDLPEIGNAAHPDIDAIKALMPELVITHSPIASSDKVVLNQAGIRVLELKSPDSFAELCQMYIQLSLIFYGAVDSQSVATDILADFDSAMSEAKAANISVSFVCVEGINSQGELILSHGKTLESDILSVFGTNLREDSEEYFVNEDELSVLSPDVVFYNSELDDDSDASDLIIEAFGSAEYIAIEIADFERPTVRLAETVRFLLAELS